VSLKHPFGGAGVLESMTNGSSKMPPCSVLFWKNICTKTLWNCLWNAIVRYFLDEDVQKNTMKLLCEMSFVQYFWDEDMQKNNYGTACGRERCTSYQDPPRAPVAGNDSFSSANYNDLAQVMRVKYSLIFIFSGSWVGDGGETKQCTLRRAK
jgi:hypothetical protein